MSKTVMDGSYPLARYLYVYVDKPSNQDLSPDILAFLRFVNSREGQERSSGPVSILSRPHGSSRTSRC